MGHAIYTTIKRAKRRLPRARQTHGNVPPPAIMPTAHQQALAIKTVKHVGTPQADEAFFLLVVIDSAGENATERASFNKTDPHRGRLLVAPHR
jgi:hypothetical protein